MVDLNNVIFDSAMLYYGDFDLTNIDTFLESLKGKELGLSDGGVTFSSTPEIRQIPVAGHLDRKLKGYERIIKVDGKVEGLSHRSLGEYAHMNFQTVKASMNRLKTLGYIDSVREGVGQNTYTYKILK